MQTIPATISLHVAAGTIWVLATILTALTGAGHRWLFALQTGAALTALVAGVFLWHALHAGLNGPPEHWLAVGTFCAFIAIGLQTAVAGPVLLGFGMADADTGKIAGPSLALYRITAALLVLAATAMIASGYS